MQVFLRVAIINKKTLEKNTTACQNYEQKHFVYKR